MFANSVLGCIFHGMHRHELTNSQWERLQPLLPPQKPKTGRPAADHRRILNGIRWLLRTGAPWRDLPERDGPWGTVASQDWPVICTWRPRRSSIAWAWRMAVFRLPIGAEGKIGDAQLGVDRWHTLALEWNISQAECRVTVDGRLARKLLLTAKTQNAVSYLRLRSTAKDIDSAGFLVESVRVALLLMA